MRLFTAMLLAALSLGCSKTETRTSDDTGTADTGDVDTGTDASPDDSGSDVGADVRPDTGVNCSYNPATPEFIPTPDHIHTPRWAFLPWISKDISDAADTYAFVDGFIARDIPVGTVVLDSPWETNYNTLVPNPERYPNFEQMVSDMGDRGLRVVLWTTQMVNEFSFDAEAGGDTYPSPSPNYPEATECGFFVNDGAQYTWWKGKGGAIDFFNPLARQWWHKQQDLVLDAGVAGWKLDFGDSYLLGDTVQTAGGEVSHQEYSEAYYRDFYDYGIDKNGHEDFLTMVRAYDKSYQFDGRFFARPENAPIVWVGDNRRDWVGLSDALDHTFRSAAAGYVVIGSDLGGYLDRDDLSLSTKIPFDRTNFMRWLAISALSPFMQLHGRGNSTPWTLPDDVDPDASVANYRFWATLHTELIPFYYSLAEEAYAGRGAPILRPLGQPADWPDDYRYMLGEALLVAPILDETGTRDVTLPDGTYYDWWTGAAATGPTTMTADFSADLRSVPLFVKRGAIVPVESGSDVTGLTGGGLSTATTVLIWPDTVASSFTLHDRDGNTTTLTAVDTGTEVQLEASRAARPIVARVRFDGTPSAVTVNGAAAAVAGDEAALLAQPSYRVDGDYVWVSGGTSAAPLSFAIVR